MLTRVQQHALDRFAKSLLTLADDSLMLSPITGYWPAAGLNRDHERSGAVVHENKVRPAALGNRAVQPKRRGRINSMGQLDFLFKAPSC